MKADRFSGSLLAIRTPISGAPALGKLLEVALADTAALAGALIDEQLLRKVSRVAVDVDVIAQRRSARFDRAFQHCFDGTRELVGFCPGNSSGRPARRNSRAKQGLAGVDVPDSHD